jgi:hypothetical protein
MDLSGLPKDILEYLSENFLELDEEARLVQVNKLINSIKRSKKFKLMKAIKDNDIDLLKSMKSELSKLGTKEIIKFIEGNESIESETIRYINITLKSKFNQKEKDLLFKLYNTRSDI